jgi:hypothetical protein
MNGWGRSAVRVTILGVFFAVALSALANAQKAPKPPKVPATTGGIAGTITGEHGTPLSGVRVTLASEEAKTTTTATTDANGAYGFENLKPGAYDVTFESKGYLSKEERTRVKAGKKNNLGERMKLPPVPKKPDTD